MLQPFRIAVVALAALCFLPAAHAQKRKDGLPPKYAKWLDEEVTYIITDDERKAFLRLTEDKARDQFIDDFWAIRNPLRGTGGANPYKEEHYRRLEYANEHFGRQSNTAGWLTDMGRAWITFGKPVSETRFTGLGQVYPCELWFYNNTTGDPALPPFFYLLFYMPGDVGEYRFYRPFLDGPLSLVRGSQFNRNKDVFDFLSHYGGDLARAAFNLIPNDPIDTQQYTVTMTSDMLVSHVLNFGNDAYNVNRIRQLRALHESVHSFLLVADQRPLDLSSVVVTDPAGQSWVDYSVLVDVPELGIVSGDGNDLNIDFSYQLKSEAGDVIVEDVQERSYAAFEESDGAKRFKPFQIAGRLPLAPGKYRLEVEIHQNKTGKAYRGFQNIAAGPTAAASITGPLLVASVEQAKRPDATTPFQYFGSQFHPSASRQFRADTGMRVLFQVDVMDPPADYELEYLLAHTQVREARRTVTETVHASQFRNGRLLTSKSLSLAGLPEGDYRLVVNVRRAGDRGMVLGSSNVGFHIVADPADAALYFDPNTAKLSQPGVAAYIRALDALAQKQESAAAVYLRQSVEQNPGNIFSDTQIVELYYRLRQYSEIARVYDKVGMAPFEGSAESLAQISMSLWNVGQQDRARDVLKTAQASFPGNPLVGALAKTVH